MHALLDVNVLIALLDPQSATHAAANDSLAANRAAGWASCPMTNPRHPAPVSPAVVLAQLDATKRDGNHAFWPDDVSITEAAVFEQAFAFRPEGE